MAGVAAAPAWLDASLVDVRGRLRYRLLRVLAIPLLRLLFRFQFHGRQLVPPAGPLVIVSNHLGWLDAPALAIAFPLAPRVNFLADADFTRESPMEWRLARQVGGVLPLLPRPLGTGWLAIRACIDRGARVAVFAEGRYGRQEGALLPFHRGFAEAALATGAPVVPVGISGTREPWLGKRITVRIGTPISPAGRDEEELVAETRAAVAALLEPAPAEPRWKPLGRFLRRLFA